MIPSLKFTERDRPEETIPTYPVLDTTLRVGTSAFTAAGWENSFYPPGAKPNNYLNYYAERFDTLEIDSTFYKCPHTNVARKWAGKVPEGFLFSAKVPQEITHKKVLVDCDAEFAQFVATMDVMGHKLGPLLLQFPYFNRQVFPDLIDFLARLKPFLKKLPKDHQFALEIRNKSWLVPQFEDALRERNVALALIDHPWMPRPTELFDRVEPKNKFDPITSDIAYVRWLGDRKAIEEKTKVWDQVIVDWQAELTEWVNVLKKVHKRKIQIFAFANNHYAGHGPSTVETFLNLWRGSGGMAEPVRGSVKQGDFGFSPAPQKGRK